ncbi:MAG: hypothetical protein EOM20_18180 [Spartobacteria bacterium]|nr:hypothetical protein [Spartobacteria bacterium]
MNYVDRLTTSFFTLLVSCLLLSVPFASGALIIDPLRTERTGAPGETIQGSITVENAREHPIVLETQFEDYSLHRATHTNWIAFETDTRPLAPGEATSFNYTVQIPVNATGEFYGRISFAEAREQDHTQMVGIRTAISVPLYVVITGTETYEAEITETRIRSKRPLRLDVTLHHTGNTHLRALGEATVRSAATGSEVCRFPINAHQVPVYPGRRDNVLTGKTDHAFTPGDYQVDVRIPFPDDAHALASSTVFTIEADNSTQATEHDGRDASGTR